MKSTKYSDQQKSNQQIINQIEINGAITENPEIIANKFNNFFTNIGPDLRKQIPVCNEKPTDYLNKGVNWMAPTTD